MDPKVWGPHYWFFLHSVAHHYPKIPNATTKKVHYRLIQNFPEFIPHRDVASNFAKMLARYPVTPYLDSRTHFVRWVHFIHNKINEHVGKPTMTLEEHRNTLRQNYAETKRVNLTISLIFAVLLGLVIYTCVV
jgi:hypothetical protein